MAQQPQNSDKRVKQLESEIKELKMAINRMKAMCMATSSRLKRADGNIRGLTTEVAALKRKLSR